MTQEHTPGPWVYTNFSKPDGSPIKTIEDIQETTAHSVKYSERLKLFGVTLNDKDEEGFSTVVCYTGNGPNAHNNAEFIARACNSHYELLEALEVVRKHINTNCEDGKLAEEAIAKARRNHEHR